LELAGGFGGASWRTRSSTEQLNWLPWTIAVHRHNTFPGLARFALEPLAEKKKGKDPRGSTHGRCATKTTVTVAAMSHKHKLQQSRNSSRRNNCPNVYENWLAEVEAEGRSLQDRKRLLSS